MKVFIVAALSADGFLSEDKSQISLEWTSKEDLHLFVELTKRAGVVIMGSTTFATFNKPLKGRRLIIYTHHPENISVEGIEATAKPPVELLADLENDGFGEVAVAGGASIYSLFLDEGLVDELYLTYEPVLFGQGIPLSLSSKRSSLSLIENRQLNENSVMLHYAINKEK